MSIQILDLGPLRALGVARRRLMSQRCMHMNGAWKDVAVVKQTVARHHRVVVVVVGKCQSATGLCLFLGFYIYRSPSSHSLLYLSSPSQDGQHGSRDLTIFQNRQNPP